MDNPFTDPNLDALSDASSLTLHSKSAPKTPTRSLPPRTIAWSTPPSKHMVDRGERGFREDLSCLLLGQGTCYWGLSLNPGDWTGIYILASGYEALRSDPFWRLVGEQFKSKLYLVPSIDMVLGRGLISVVLIEGDPDFLQNQLVSVPSDWSVLFLLPPGWTRPPLPNVTWLSVTHKQCGGVTTARMNVGCKNIASIHFKLTVRRTIASVLNHSIRPQPCGPEGPGVKCYSDASLLHTRAVSLPVRVPTTFHKTGWGYRPLTPSEIGAVYDLPLWKDPTLPGFDWWHSQLLYPRFVPIKIPSTVLTAALPHLNPVLIHVTCEHAGIKRDPTPLSPLTPKRGRWTALSPETMHQGRVGTSFPKIGAFLPHSAWLDESLIVAKATKADDAVTPYWLWDERIRGVFPWITAAALEGFRVLACVGGAEAFFEASSFTCAHVLGLIGGVLFVILLPLRGGTLFLRPRSGTLLVPFSPNFFLPAGGTGITALP